MSSSKICFLTLGIFLSVGLYVSQCSGKSESVNNEMSENIADPGQKMEYPAFSKNDDVVYHTAYTVGYNHKTLTPNWVAYELTDAEANGSLPRDDQFGPDPVMNGRQAQLEDYRGSGWDRGHMAPAADMKWSANAMSECFYLTNMCPQNHSMNAGQWETTEKMARRLAKQYGKVFIVCGPVYAERKYGTIGVNKVAVPDAFFKAFLIESQGTYAAIGFLMDNSESAARLKEASMPVDELEQLIGRDLFPNLSDDIENEVESHIVKKYWGI